MSKEKLLLTKENIPCYYELSLKEVDGVPSIIFRVHNDSIETYDGFLPRLDNVYNKELGDFLNDFTRDIGYKGIIKYLKKRVEFTEFEIRIPTQEEEIRLTVISLSVLFKIFLFPKKKTRCDLYQLFEINLSTDDGDKGPSISGSIGVSMAAWLKSLSETQIESVTKAGRIACEYMDGITAITDKYDFDVSVREGKLFINCPGDRAGIDTIDNVRDGKGFDFGCHNVDANVYILTLLVALAELHDLAREKMK